VGIKTTATPGQVFLHMCDFLPLSRDLTARDGCWSRSDHTDYTITMSCGEKQRIHC